MHDQARRTQAVRTRLSLSIAVVVTMAAACSSSPPISGSVTTLAPTIPTATVVEQAFDGTVRPAGA